MNQGASTLTIDKHIVIGGKYFDVLNGTYELQQFNDNTYRLKLYSHFKLTTTFNFYARLVGKVDYGRLQNKILQVEKQRVENK